MLILVFCAPAANSQDLPELLTLPVLLRLVAERSPRLAVERVGIESAQADLITAGALPNPTLSYGRMRPSSGANTLFEGNRQQQAGVEFPLLIAGQRGARVETAEQGVLRRARARRPGGQRTGAARRGTVHGTAGGAGKEPWCSPRRMPSSSARRG